MLVSYTLKILYCKDNKIGTFCKFFKNTCGKTFSDYVNDIRVAHACTLLFNSDKAISLVAIISGFENLAYFNRVFLKKKSVVPSKFSV
jgi:AraC-like DNA-binding protein